VKYYVYISDTKLDMLAGQIKKSVVKGMAGELKLDLKVLSLSLTDKPSDETRYAKLQLVDEYLTTSGDVGSVDSPRSYVRGTMTMRWGPYVRNTLRGGPSTGLVVFGGQMESTYVGLGGSEHHLVGGRRGESTPTAWSASPYLFAALAPDLGEAPPRESFDEPGRWEDLYQDKRSMLLATRRAIQSMKGPAQRLEFLAKRVLDGPIGSDSVILGSPIYVALAD
jgi:hypothetical protein